MYKFYIETFNYKGYLGHLFTLKTYFDVNKFHYPIYNINIWNFCKNSRPWLFLNERGNGKSAAFISAICCTRR